jgi:hypothetical protein
MRMTEWGRVAGKMGSALSLEGGDREGTIILRLRLDMGSSVQLPRFKIISLTPFWILGHK